MYVPGADEVHNFARARKPFHDNESEQQAFATDSKVRPAVRLGNGSLTVRAVVADLARLAEKVGVTNWVP